MSNDLLSSKIVVEEEQPSVHQVPSAPTSVVGAVGIAQRGPIGVPVLCTSPEDYQAAFGGYTPDSDLTLAAMGYFENGGSQLWVVRTVHYGSPAGDSAPTAVTAVGFITAGGGPAGAVLVGGTAAPFVLHDGDLLRLSVGGGADTDAVFHGVPASVVAGAAAPYALAGGETLDVQIDGGAVQVVTFAATDFADPTHATAAEVAASMNAQIVGGSATAAGGLVHIASDTHGTASRVQVSGGTANGALTFPTLAVVGAGNVASLRGTQLAEVAGVVEAAIPGITLTPTSAGQIQIQTAAVGIAATVQSRAQSAAAFGLDTALHTGSASGSANAIRVSGKDPGAYANDVEVETRGATNGSPAAFDLLVIQDGVYREPFPNLTTNATDARYFGTIVNDPTAGSDLIHLSDELLPGAPVPPPQTVVLSGGDDGLVGLDDQDFIGVETIKSGLYALDQVQDLAVLIVPGRATPAVHNAMVAYAEVTRGGTVFPILDPPAHQRAVDIVTYVTTTAGLEELSEFGAIYWPRVMVLNPDTTVFGSASQIVVPPSGIIAGVYARTDAARSGGVYDPPAGIDVGQMIGVLGFETNEVLEEAKRDLVYPHRINPLTTGTSQPKYIDGSRTLKSTGNFPYIAERRGVIFIERSLKLGLQFARHKNNTEGLRAQVRRTSTAFLLTQMNNGAFRSKDPKTAFFVDVSDKLNPPSVVFAGQLIARYGLATNKPAEFIILKISQDTRALDAELAAASS